MLYGLSNDKHGGVKTVELSILDLIFHKVLYFCTIHLEPIDEHANEDIGWRRNVQTHGLLFR